MTFAAPLVLLGLLALPAVAIAYVRIQRARVRSAQAFSSPLLMESVAPSRPGWRRHVPMAAFALSLAVLVVAAARPQTTVAVPVEQASIMLVTDVSGSMLATDVAPSRLVAARRAAQRFLDEVPARVKVGVMAFNHVPSLLQPPTRDRAAARDALGRLAASGGTATGDAVQAATRILTGATGATGKQPPAAIVLLSDGASTRGSDPVQAAQAAGRRHIPIYTGALGTASGTIKVPRSGGRIETRKVPPDSRSLAQMARASGGHAYTAAAAGRLSRVYQRLGSQLGRKKEHHPITAGFAGGGLALLALGAALSLRWFGRLI
ncbi:MAG: Ca-activated chloride channel [Solirubrobacteraceae bacterium]|nr:Ca-activated chloride channel [Solirubrobacteraceae bacterium]